MLHRDEAASPRVGFLALISRSHPFGTCTSMASCTPPHSTSLLWQQSCALTAGTVRVLAIRHGQHKSQPRQQHSNSPGQLQARPRSVTGSPWQSLPCHSPCPPGSPLLYQPTVDGDPFLGSLASGTRPLQPLRASQVHKVKLGCQGLVLSSRLGSIQKAAHLLIHLQPGTQEGSPPQAGAGRGSLAFTQTSARV